MYDLSEPYRLVSVGSPAQSILKIVVSGLFGIHLRRGAAFEMQPWTVDTGL